MDWKKVEISSCAQSNGLTDALGNAIELEAIREQKEVYTLSRNRECLDFKTFCDKLPIIHKVLFEDETYEEGDESKPIIRFEKILVTENGYISLTYAKKHADLENYLSINSYFLDKQDYLVFKQFIYEMSRPVPRKRDGHIYTVRDSNGSLTISSLGDISQNLIHDNYSPDVINDINHVIEDLNSNSPCGKISIFAGPPGTGKTHLLKGLVNKVSNAKFVLFPANLIPSLTGPALINILFNLKDYGEAHERFILVIEDADEVLVPRALDNASGITTILNLSDGLLGDSFNLRIIATTNAKSDSIDEAIVRPGRLCRRIFVDKLSAEQANKVYTRLFEQKGVFTNPATLAEVYGSSPKKKNRPTPVKKPFGFSH